MPDALLVEGDRLAGLRFRRTRAEAGKIVPCDETFEARGPYVVSSIGSIPEPIEGIETKGELFRFTDWELGRLDGYPNVVFRGQRRHRQGQHRRLAQARGVGREQGGRGDREAPAGGRRGAGRRARARTRAPARDRLPGRLRRLDGSA